MRALQFTSCLSVLLAGGALGRPAAGQHGPAPVTEINTLLDAWHRAAAVGDEKAYFGAMDSGAVYLGTDPDERWSKQAFHEWAKPQFARGSAWAFTPFGRHVTVASGGDLAWFDEKLKWFDSKLNTWMGTLRGTGVVHRTAQGWRIVQYNLTMELPNDRLGDVVHLLRVSRAVAPADRREITAAVRRLLGALAAHDSLQVRAALDSNAQVVIVTARDSTSPIAVWTAAEYAGMVAASSRASHDSIAEVTMLGDGSVAVVWAPFTTYEGTQRSGCGLAQFQVLNVRSAWRITSLAVHPAERCPESGTR